VYRGKRAINWNPLFTEAVFLYVIHRAGQTLFHTPWQNPLALFIFALVRLYIYICEYTAMRDSQDRTPRAGQPEQNSQSRKARKGQTEQDRQNGARTALPV
jgi:hypothetical protein